ncbi:MAG: hypothetical protein IJA34_05010 [Lachnospiraceae bacterium]|nr:hypothetical protein [Lachnospiraceae bacterium]
MITIYDKDVINLDYEYDRNEILKYCWSITNSEKLRFVVYKEGKICKALSYYDILYDRNVRDKCIQFERNVFIESRKYFLEEGLDDYRCVPVCNDMGNLMYILEYHKNVMLGINKNGWNYEGLEKYIINEDIDTLDYTLFNNIHMVVIEELEEYTYAIVKLLKNKYKDMNIIFIDKKAELFFENSEVTVIDNICDADLIIDERNAIYIVSKLFFEQINGSKKFLKVYNSVNVMVSFLWCANRNIIGSERQIILKIDFSADKAGLVDIVSSVANWVYIAEKRGWIPYVDLCHFPNQYLETEEDNMWEYLFEPIVDLPKNLNEYNIISIWENREVTNGIYASTVQINPYTFEHSKKNYLRYIAKRMKIKETVKNEIKQLIPKEMFENKKILGVIMRGSDMRKEQMESSGVVLKNWGAACEIDKMIKVVHDKCRIWGFDKIFLATEEVLYLKKFQEVYGEDNVVFVNQPRIEWDIERDKETSLYDKYLGVDRKVFLKKYYAVLCTLMECDALLSSASCGAYLYVNAIMDEKYLFSEIVY